MRGILNYKGIPVYRGSKKKNLQQLEINKKWAEGTNSATCNHF